MCVLILGLSTPVSPVSAASLRRADEVLPSTIRVSVAADGGQVQ